jgi:hypothetical protein
MRQDRWQNLTACAFRLEETLERLREQGGLSPEARAETRDGCVRALLDNLLEVFPHTLDPVEDFEGFAVRRLAQALRRACDPVP